MADKKTLRSIKKNSGVALGNRFELASADFNDRQFP